MKRLTAFMLLFLTFMVFGQDSAQYNGKAGIADVAEDDPGMFMLMMFMLMTIALALIFTIFLAIIIWIFLLGLAFAGIISLSVFAGWYQRSVKAGLRWFVFLTFAFVGMGGGALIYFIIASIAGWDLSWRDGLLYALPSGLVGGLIAAWVCLLMIKRLFGFVKSKLLNHRVGS